MSASRRSVRPNSGVAIIDWKPRPIARLCSIRSCVSRTERAQRKAFRDGLAKLGWFEDRNLRIDVRLTTGHTLLRGRPLDNVPAELRDGLHLPKVKYVRTVFASVEYVEMLQIDRS